MASGTTTPRVRLVRCPKCRVVLPEVENVPLYKCGGCDTILVVKNRKATVESTFLLQEIGDADSDKVVHVSENGESTSSTPLEVHLCQESGSQSGKHDENLSIRRRYNDRHTSGDTDYKCEKLDENGSSESGQLQLESSEHCNVQQQGVSIEAILPTDLHEDQELMMIEGAYSEFDTNNKNGSNIRDSSFDNPYAAKEISATIIASPAAGEVLSSDILFSSPNEHMEQPRISEHQGLNHVRSTDSFETADFVSPTSEFSDPDIERFSKSAATGISDGSIPSDVGMDDQFLGQKIHSFENNYRDANYLVPEERQRREKLPAKSLMNGNARNLSSDLSNKKPYGTPKYRKWHPDEALEPVMHRCLPKNWTKEVRDEYPSRIPFSHGTSLPGCKNAGPSRELHDEFPDYSEQESMKLLRLVSELQDQISKRCNLNGRKFVGRDSIDVPWRQKHFPTYNYPEEEFFYPRHEIGKSCLCCHAQVWPRSEQLPHPKFPHNQGFCRVHPGHSCYDCYRYCSSSPQRHMESGFSSWIISGDQRYGAGKLKRYSREKHYSVRRYRRPMAGGAPFVTCYHCFRPLELPADFLLSERRFQQLQCGACLKVLRFSLQNGNHIVPYEQVGCRTTTNET